MRRINIKPKIIFYIFIAIIILLVLLYGNIIYKNIKRYNFAKDMINIVEKNEKPIFSVEKIYLCSSANVIDNSVEKNLQDLSIYQYADIAIHINNRKNIEELTNKNTIKQLYIDNISLEASSDIGEKSLFYTNSLNIGQNTDFQNAVATDRIDFNIIYTNSDNNMADYSKPTFYTDCSNPITLKYLNNNIVKGYKMNEDSSISFDGKLLKKVGIPVDDIKCNIKFRVNIINNNEEKFSCWLNFDIPLDNLYSKGTTINSAITSGEKYDFFFHAE